MKRSTTTVCVAITALALFLAGWWLWKKEGEICSPPASVQTHNTKPAPGTPLAGSDAPLTFAEWSQSRNEAQQAGAIRDPWPAFIEWKQEWDASGDIAGLARALVGFLESGIDFESGEEFRVGPGGRLRAAPSARVAALDWLGDVDPEGAASFAQTIFSQSTVPEEWAVALRNYGRYSTAPARDPYFELRVREFLANANWGSHPTSGFLEGFDAAVASGTPDVVKDLVALSVDAENPVTRLAAQMALHNLSRRDPVLLAAVVNVPDSALAQTPVQRSALLARLDPRDPRHIAEITRYLSEVATSPDEVQAFMDVFPNAHDFAAHYLLTVQAPRDLREQALIDLAAYKLVRQWQDQDMLAEHHESLMRMKDRLSAYVESAIRGGFLPAESTTN